MVFDGFSVDNIWGFKQHFSVKGLIEAIDNQFVLVNWFHIIKASGSLDDNEKELLEKIQHDYGLLSADAECTEWAQLRDVSNANGDFAQKLLLWEKSVDSKRSRQYRNFCIMLLRFLALGNHTIGGDSEEEIVLNYLIEEGYVKTALLELKRIDHEKVGIYYDESLVAEMKCEQESQGNELVFTAGHKDTGYIGIDKRGEIINKSAFHIPAVEGKAVKAAINQAAYVILLENGKLIHNLKFTDLPEAPVKNMELHGEQLVWQLME